MPRSSPSGYNLKKEFPSVHFGDPAGSGRALVNLHEIFLSSGTRFPPEDLDRILREFVLRSPDPDRMIRNLLRFVEASVSRATLFNDLVRFHPIADLLCTLFGQSQYFSDILVRDPELFHWLTATGVLHADAPSPPLRDEVIRIMETFSSAGRRMDGLRRLYRREVLRIGARDLLGLADLTNATLSLSRLADHMIDGANLVAANELADHFPVLPDTPFCIIGLGKLGGEELNYSSDIDLMFVYGEEGDVKSDDAEYTFHEYFVRRTALVTRLLSESSGEGHLYRVDARLRPEGGAGPLARSVQGYIDYYEARGELWERQMLIKARPVGGDHEIGHHLLHQLSPFVYPRTHFINPAESVSRIKEKIEASTTEGNIKLRAGGIRDIEFAVQTLQLLHGGRDAAVRSGNTLEAIRKLTARKLLSADEKEILSAAYSLFRTVEHRLQIALNTQTHTLPADAREFTALARGIGFRDRKEFAEHIDRYFQGVKLIFDEILSGSGDPGSKASSLGDVSGMEEYLRRNLFRDHKKALRNMQVLSGGSGMSGERRLDNRQTDAFRAVAGILLEGIVASPVPDMTLANLANLASVQAFPEQFYRQLKDKAFRSMIMRVCGTSTTLSKAMARFPELPERIGAGQHSESVSIPETATGLPAYKDKSESMLGILHLLGVITFDEMTAGLTNLADSMVGAIGTRVRKRRRLRSLPLAAFALGKYGTGELSFGSDLDLLFICQSGKGVKRAPLERFCQDLVRGLSDISEHGQLYDVDARLRPEGRSAPLVADVEGLGDYLTTRASLWERQSMTRIRLVWGDPKVGSAVIDLVNSFVYDSPLPGGWTDTIVAMRKKMESRSRVRRTGYIDIKLGAGGMVDVEFIAQMIQLSEARRLPSLQGPLPAVTIIRMAPRKVLKRTEAAFLEKQYRLFRDLEKLMRLTIGERGSILPEGEKLETLSRCHDQSDGPKLRQSVSAGMQEVRSLLESVAGRLRSQ
ncbi:MAG: hypothetical protein OEV30_09765 [Ignavibacteria bacterium]|nr:hypothetical protein [Ignavibacteria bacterium]